VGQGSVFTFRARFDVDQEAVALAAGNQRERVIRFAPPPQVGERDRLILLVEDNPVNQKIMLRALEKSGCRADAVSTGQEAVEAVRKYRYDLVLMDVQMPGMDGFEATAAIRRLGGRAARVPIVAMTANAMAGDRERCLEGGMDDYISKPVQMAELGATLAHWIK